MLRNELAGRQGFEPRYADPESSYLLYPAWHGICHINVTHLFYIVIHVRFAGNRGQSWT